MAKKRFYLGILAITLIFGFFLTGCEDDLGGGYTIEFKVTIPRGLTTNGKTTKIEFINGSSINSPVLQTYTANIDNGEMTGVYKVSGFTEKDGDDKRIYGVKISRDGESPKFRWASATNKSKIIVNDSYGSDIYFTNGSW